MKVRVHDKRWKNTQTLYHCIEFAAFGQDAITVVFKLVYFIAGSHAQQGPRRSAHFLDPSALYFLQMLWLSKYVHSTSSPGQTSSTPVRRKSLPLARDFQSQCFDIEH
jgi:hypothetical protein